jgi:hypothetical protein
MLPLGGLHVKHATQRRIWIATEHFLWDQGKSRKTLIEWPASASELYRPSDRRSSVKLVPTFADRGCHDASVTDPFGRILGSLHRSRYFFFQVAPQLYSRG